MLEVNNVSPQRRRERKEKLVVTENEISSKIIGACIEVHKQLGPGLLESTYEVCLAHELTSMGWSVKSQIQLPVVYKEIKLNAGC